MVLTGIINSDDDEEENADNKTQKEITLVACEQRTSIAWLEAIDLMLANKKRMGDTVSSVVVLYDVLQCIIVCLYSKNYIT
jgi:hypothetical protein